MFQTQTLWPVVMVVALLAWTGCSTGGSTQREGASAEAQESRREVQGAGELELPAMARPFEGMISAGQPSKAEFRTLTSTEVRTVINLRGAGEEGTWDEAAMAEQMGLEYVNIPITGPEDLTRGAVDLFSDVLRKEEGDFLVHCGSSNRVGAMFALRAFWLMGKSKEEALAIGEKAGLDTLEGAVRRKMEETK